VSLTAYAHEPETLSPTYDERIPTAAIDIPARSDGLPEMANYRDTGCSVSPSCLRCPLVRCKYDEPPRASLLAERRRVRQARAERVRRLLDVGTSMGVAAASLGVSKRTLYRDLEAEGGK
jgi:hypothetical protein